MEPHIYRPGKGVTAIYLAVAAVLALASIGSLVFLIGPDRFGIPVTTTWSGPRIVIWFVVALVGPCLAAYLAATALTRRIVLHPDAIEERGVFRSRRLARGDIAGKQVMKGVVTMYLLFPKDPEGKIFQVTGQDDFYFREWIARVPDRAPSTDREASIRW
ncbi:MAG TPA: hypothetical protein VGF56_10565 [Rhizomicrobium sp.]|jgi:hypothetical protein